MNRQRRQQDNRDGDKKRSDDAGGAGGGGGEQKRERPKKESIIDLSKFIDKQVHVKFQGGREATGKLKGFDHLLNLVLDDTTEYLKDDDESHKATENKRKLGLVVCRGPAVTIVCPQDGYEVIQNPFVDEST